MLNKTFILSIFASTIISTSVSAAPLVSQAYGLENNKTISSTVLISTQNTAAAKIFIEDLATKGISFLEDNSLNQDQRRKEFRNVLKNNFDMKTIARFALGTYWRQATKAEKKEYLALFENTVVNVYSRRFSEYNGQEFEVASARPQGKRDTIVTSYIVQNGGQKISIDWRLRQKKDGSLKIIDIMVEGVSMSVTQRSDFSSVIQRGGGKVNVLIEHLRANK